MTPSWPLTIYYDASCPLCRQEMDALAAADGRGRLRLHDISGDHSLDDACRDAGLGKAELMRRIHARDADGRWYRNIDVFEHAYAAAGLEGMARLWGHPRLRSLWDRLYPWVADHRQGLSWFRLHRLFGWLVRRAARRAQRRAQACSDGLCTAPDTVEPTHGVGVAHRPEPR